MKILIVDDQRSTAELIRKQLIPVSVDVEIAGSVSEMMMFMHRIPPPDLVFLDIFLPDSFSPEETLHHISYVKSINPNAIVIVITGLPLDSLPKLAFEMGADCFSFKMDIIGQRNLLEIVHKQLAKMPDIRARIEMGAEVYEKLCGLLGAVA